MLETLEEDINAAQDGAMTGMGDSDAELDELNDDADHGGVSLACSLVARRPVAVCSHLSFQKDTDQVCSTHRLSVCYAVSAIHNPGKLLLPAVRGLFRCEAISSEYVSLL